MKKTIAIFLSLSMAVSLSSFLKADATEKVTADYVGFYEDEDDHIDYYSFESEDDFLEFTDVNEELIKKFALKSEESVGKSYTVEYTRDQETDELELLNLLPR